MGCSCMAIIYIYTVVSVQYNERWVSPRYCLSLLYYDVDSMLLLLLLGNQIKIP